MIVMLLQTFLYLLAGRTRLRVI